MRKSKSIAKAPRQLQKCPTGIRGLDEITLGGLPSGRTTLICGGAGSGKTLFGVEFLVRGAQKYGESGVGISFDETAEDIAQNAVSLGFAIDDLIKSGSLLFDYIHLDKSQISETGDYDLEALFIRIGSAIDAIGAKRVLIDTPEALFAGLTDTGLLRSELQRLFRWLKDKGLTAIVTGEQGRGTLTRHGLEEYISDCVIALDHRVQDSVVTRRLRIVKYRGSVHGTDEYPFLIDEDGISVLPVTSIGLNHPASDERISTGVPGLNEMLGGGFYRGSSILASGAAGTGKTSLAAHFADAACKRGEICLFLSHEESPQQLTRNMRSIGIDLERWSKKGLLRLHATRPTMYGLERHLVMLHKLIEKYKPRVVVIDPISSLIAGGSGREVTIVLLRMIDHLKLTGISGFFTALTSERNATETELEISSLIDSWLLLRNVETNAERNRLLYIYKTRGMASSNQVREFLMTDNGVMLRDVYVGPGGVLTGSARLAQENRDLETELRQRNEVRRKRKLLTGRHRSLDARIVALQTEKEAAEQEFEGLESEAELERKVTAGQRQTLAASRQAPDKGAARRAKR
ncbi:MAG: circadian clock protein KaiC [Bryobacteraceae bacterium]